MLRNPTGGLPAIQTGLAVKKPLYYSELRFQGTIMTVGILDNIKGLRVQS